MWVLTFSVIGAVLLIITIAGLWMFLYERNRSQQLSLVAGQLGLQFSRDKSPSIPGLYVEGGNDTIIFFKAGKRLKPGEVQNFLLEGIRGLVVFRMKGSG